MLSTFLQWLVVRTLKKKTCKDAENIKHLDQHYLTILTGAGRKKAGAGG